MIKKILISVMMASFTLGATAKTYNGFTASQLKSLKDVKLPVIIAGWVPKGFSVDKITVEFFSKQDPTGFDNYRITYNNDFGKTFSIEVQDGGIGDFADEPNLHIKNMFGNIDVYTNQNKCVQTGWITYKGRGYLFMGCNKNDFYRNVEAGSISKEDALKVIKNLTLLK